MNTATLDVQETAALQGSGTQPIGAIVQWRGTDERPVQRALAVAIQEKPPTFHLRLTDDRRILVDGKRVVLPRGTGTRITGSLLRVLAKICTGYTLYFSTDGAMVRVLDSDIVELHDGAGFTSRDERPKKPEVRPQKVTSRPSFSGD